MRATISGMISHHLLPERAATIPKTADNTKLAPMIGSSQFGLLRYRYYLTSETAGRVN